MSGGGYGDEQKRPRVGRDRQMRLRRGLPEREQVSQSRLARMVKPRAMPVVSRQSRANSTIADAVSSAWTHAH